MTLQETLTRLRDESAKEKQLPYSDELKPIIGAYWCGGFDHAQDLLLPLIEKMKLVLEYSAINLMTCEEHKRGENPPWCTNDCQAKIRSIEALSELKKLEEGLGK